MTKEDIQKIIDKYKPNVAKPDKQCIWCGNNMPWYKHKFCRTNCCVQMRRSKRIATLPNKKKSSITNK